MAHEMVPGTQPWGQLSEDEGLELMKEARRQWDLSLARASAEGREEGREEGQRVELLRLIENLDGPETAGRLRHEPVGRLRAALDDIVRRRTP